MPPANTTEIVPCPTCGRGFAKERVETHAKICANQKERPVFDVVKSRIKGTEAEDLYKAGKLKLEPAKPIPKKSELAKKLNLDATPGGVPEKTEPLPPIKKKETEKKGNATAYQVVFDNDELKTTKNSKFGPLNRRTARPQKPIDERYLSAEIARGRWRSAAQRVSPGASSFASDDSDDYLGASMASQKTVCSDAFDFLFDHANLNPEKILDHQELKNYTDRKAEGSPDLKKKGSCCAIM